MSFTLSKRDLTRRDDIIKRLTNASTELTNAVSTYNSAIEELKPPVEKALAAYNEIVVEAKSFADDIAAQAETEIGEKSDAWQEGDKGQAAEEWKSEWENIDLEEVEIEFPEELDFDEPEHVANLEQAPEEVST